MLNNACCNCSKGWFWFEPKSINAVEFTLANIPKEIASFYVDLWSMKNIIIIGLIITFFASCEPDTKDEPNLDIRVDFVGTWNRDSITETEIENNGTRTLISAASNAGKYVFNADKTGVLSVIAGDFAINWSHNASAKTILISEVDWVGQVYNVITISETEVRLIGIRNIGGGLQEERILKLSKR